MDEKKDVLVLIQSELKNAHNETENKFFKSRYTPLAVWLDMIRPVCNKHGLFLTQKIDQVDDKISITTVLRRDVEIEIQGTCVTMKAKDMLPQSIAATITYARRYSLITFFGLVGDDEDDDGNEASGRTASKKENDKKSVEEIQNKLDNLPDEIKELFRKSKFTKTGVITFCENYKWDTDIILEKLKIIV